MNALSGWDPWLHLGFHFNARVPGESHTQGTGPGHIGWDTAQLCSLTKPSVTVASWPLAHPKEFHYYSKALGVRAVRFGFPELLFHQQKPHPGAEGLVEEGGRLGGTGKEKRGLKHSGQRGPFSMEQAQGSHLLSVALGGGQAGRPSDPRALFSASLYTTWKTGPRRCGGDIRPGHGMLPLQVQGGQGDSAPSGALGVGATCGPAL